MTAPVLVAGVSTPSGPKDMLFILGANNVVFALDANSGQVLWQKSYPNPASPLKPKEWLCPGTPNDTPTIDKARGVVFFITGDGVLRGLNLADGAERLAPVPMTAPFARAWSLNLIDNVLYSTSGRACGEVSDKASLEYAAAISGLRRAGNGPLLDASAVNAADVSDLAHPQVTHFFVSGARPAAPWGRGGAARAPGGIVLETSDGRYDPAAGDFSESILQGFAQGGAADGQLHAHQLDGQSDARHVGLGHAGGVQLRRQDPGRGLAEGGGAAHPRRRQPGRTQPHDAAVAVVQAGQ